MSETTTKTDEIDLIDLIRKVWKRRMFIIKLALIGSVAGIVIGLSLPKEYTAIVKMAPEGGGTSGSSGMAGLAAMAGINLGQSGTDGLNTELYPDIVASMPFILEISQIPVQGKKMDKPVILYDYIDEDSKSPWWTTVISLPFKALGWVISLFKENEEEDTGSAMNLYDLTPTQSAVLTGIQQRIAVSVDKKTNIITATAQMQDPAISAQVVDSLVNKLEEYMIGYRTQKAKQDRDFTQAQFNDAREKYYDAKRRYAVYRDANRNIILESVRVEQERLQNEQQIAYSVYSQLAQQLELAKIKVQEQTPCLTIIEPARIPLRKSSMSTTMLLMAFTFLGGFAGVGIIVVKDLLGSKKEDETLQA